jgi:hypothetical protein
MIDPKTRHAISVLSACIVAFLAVASVGLIICSHYPPPGTQSVPPTSEGGVG